MGKIFLGLAQIVLLNLARCEIRKRLLSRFYYWQYQAGGLEIDFLTERFKADQKSKTFFPFFVEFEKTDHKSHLPYLGMTTTKKVSSLNFCISETFRFQR